MSIRISLEIGNTKKGIQHLLREYLPSHKGLGPLNKRKAEKAENSA